MDLASIPFDLTQAGAILADMVAAFFDPPPPPVAEERRDDHDELEDQPKPPGATGLYLHPAIDAGPGAVQSREHRAAVQSDEQGPGLRMEPGADPSSGWRSGPVRIRRRQPGRLQTPCERCGIGPSGRDLLLGGVATGAFEPGLASPSGAVRYHQHPRGRRGWLLQSSRVQRLSGPRHEGRLRSGGIAYHPRAPPWWQTK